MTTWLGRGRHGVHAVLAVLELALVAAHGVLRGYSGAVAASKVLR